MKFYLKYLVYLSLGILGLTVYYSYKLHEVYEIKINQQKAINQNAEQIKATWQGLQPTIDAWKSSFVGITSVNSLYELNKVLGLHSAGVNLSASSMFEAGTSAISYQGVDLGLVSRCVKNKGNGFMIQSSNLENALNVLSYIEHRLDLSWNEVTLSSSEQGFQLQFPSLCVHLRVLEGEE